MAATSSGLRLAARTSGLGGGRPRGSPRASSASTRQRCSGPPRPSSGATPERALRFRMQRHVRLHGPRDVQNPRYASFLETSAAGRAGSSLVPGEDDGVTRSGGRDLELFGLSTTGTSPPAPKQRQTRPKLRCTGPAGRTGATGSAATPEPGASEAGALGLVLGGWGDASSVLGSGGKRQAMVACGQGG